MIFDRLHLIAQVDNRIADLAERHIDKYFAAVKLYEKRLADWRLNQAPVLVIELQAYALKAANGDPVVRQEFEKTFGNHWHGPLFNYFEPDPPAEFETPPELIALKRFLESVVSPTVSTSALAESGFRNFRAYLGAP